MVTKDKTGLSEILFALRMNPSAAKKSPFERHTGQEPNTIKRILTNHKQVISDNQEVNINNDDFKSGQDSAILVRERARGTKLEGLCKKEEGCATGEQQPHNNIPPSRPNAINNNLKTRFWTERE